MITTRRQQRGAWRLLRPYIRYVARPAPRGTRSAHCLTHRTMVPHRGTRRLAGECKAHKLAMRRCCAQRTSVSEGRQVPRRLTDPLIGVARGATDPHTACSTACRTMLARQVHGTLPHVLCGGFSLAQARRALEPEGTRAAHKASTAGCECDRTPQLVDFLPTHPPMHPPSLGVDADPRVRC